MATVQPEMPATEDPVATVEGNTSFDAAEAETLKKMRTLLEDLVKLDTSTNEEILFYDERESCVEFLNNSPTAISADTIMLASFAGSAKVRYETWLSTHPQMGGRRRLNRIDRLMNDALEAFDACLELARARDIGTAVQEENNVFMRLFFLLLEVRMINRQCNGDLMSEEESENLNELVADLQGDAATSKLRAATIVQSAISDVIIARYEAWIRASGQADPEKLVDRIDTATDKVSSAIDALLAVGRGRAVATTGNFEGITAFWAQLKAPEFGTMHKPRSRGAAAGRGKAVKVVTVAVPPPEETKDDEVPEVADGGASTSTGVTVESIRGMVVEAFTPRGESTPRGDLTPRQRLAVRVAVTAAAVAVPVALSMSLRRSNSKTKR